MKKLVTLPASLVWVVSVLLNVLFFPAWYAYVSKSLKKINMGNLKGMPTEKVYYKSYLLFAVLLATNIVAATYFKNSFSSGNPFIVLLLALLVAWCLWAWVFGIYTLSKYLIIVENSLNIKCDGTPSGFALLNVLLYFGVIKFQLRLNNLIRIKSEIP